MTTLSIEQRIERILPEIKALRHDLHRHPELAYQERRTAGRVVEYISDIDGLHIREGVGGTGLAITIGGDLPGACVALRADMDALPIEEQSGVEWTSTTSGRMHACGHDGHTAMLAGAIRLVAEMRDQLTGPVKFLFQPAEEGGAGADAMCRDGALEDPQVAAVFGLHNNLPDPSMKIGQIAYVPGAAMAGTGNFDIIVQGRGGHAAFPHRTIDPVYIAASIVDQLQGIVSRNIDPMVPAVLSVTRMEAGSAYNIIPGRAHLAGTIRALDKAVLENLRELLIQRAREVAAAHGGSVEVDCRLSYPVLVNDPQAEACFREMLAVSGIRQPLVRVDPILGGEDFAFFCLKVPSFFYFLPSCPEFLPANPVCHHPAFDFNDDLLPLGMRLHAETALHFARIWKT